MCMCVCVHERMGTLTNDSFKETVRAGGERDRQTDRDRERERESVREIG